MARPTPEPPAGPVKEVQVSFSLNTGLREDARRDAVWNLLYDLAERIDEQDASHIQAVVKVVLPEEAVEALRKLAAEAGVTVSVTSIS